MVEISLFKINNYKANDFIVITVKQGKADLISITLQKAKVKRLKFILI